MEHRLVIVEGLPCSGKSTTSRFVSEVLSESHRVVFVDEGSGDHPADYEFSAYLSAEELCGFSAEQQALITAHARQSCSGVVVPLSEFTGELFDRLLEHKIYDMLPWEQERPVMLDKWRSFCDSADKDAVYVFNCVLLQNPMCETMMRFGFSQHQSFQYISEIAEMTEPLSPLVIYLRTADIAAAVKKAASEREGWLDAVIDYHVNGAYGRSVGAVGFDGYIACLEERQRRELAVLSQLSVRSVVLDDPSADWDGAYKRLRDLICL